MTVLLLTSMKSVLYKLCIRGEKVEVLGSGNSHVIFFFFSFCLQLNGSMISFCNFGDLLKIIM